MLIRESALEQMAKEHRVTLQPGVVEKMEMKLVEIFLSALEKARKEGRMFLKPSDITISKRWKGQVVRRLRVEEARPDRPLVERRTTRFGFYDVVERTKGGS